MGRKIEFTITVEFDSNDGRTDAELVKAVGYWWNMQAISCAELSYNDGFGPLYTSVTDGEPKLVEGS